MKKNHAPKNQKLMKNNNHRIDLSILPIFLTKISNNNMNKEKLKYHESPKIYPSRSHITKRSFHKIVLYEKNSRYNKSKVKQNINALSSVTYSKNRSPKEKLKWVGFFVLIGIFFINTLYISARFLDNNYEYKLFPFAHIEAVISGQDIAEPLQVGIIRIGKIDFDELKIGDQVVVCCDYNLEDTNWVETVVAINHTNQTIRTTYDGLFSLTTDFDDVYGLYLNQSGFMGTLYYSATFIRGYLLIFSSQLLILYGYFYIVLKRRKDRLF